MSYRYPQRYLFSTFKNKKIFLAVFVPHRERLNHDDFEQQGFFYLCDFYAYNSIEAVDMAKNWYEDELFKLRSENKRILSHKFGYTENEDIEQFIIDKLDPYKVLGISETSSESDITKRYQKLRSNFHTDNEGSSFLFRLVKNAYDRISND